MKQYNDVDVVLGNSATRYFGQGYREVSYELTNVILDCEQQSISAKLNINYPLSWSSKQSEGILTPHLGTLDAFLTSCQLADALVFQLFQLTLEEGRKTWLRSILIQSGNVPCRDLENIPVYCKLLTSNRQNVKLGDLISRIEVSLSDLKVILELDHKGDVHDVRKKDILSLAHSIDFLERNHHSYHGYYYRDTQHHIKGICVDEEKQEVQAQISQKLYIPSVDLGMASAFSSHYHTLDLIVSGAQLAQILCYQIDNLPRSETNNLWMRKVGCFMPQPIDDRLSLLLEIHTQKSRLFKKAEGEWWRLCNGGVTTDRDKEFSMTASMTHQLPSAGYTNYRKG